MTRKQWVVSNSSSSPSQTKTKVPDAVKDTLTEKARVVIDNIIKPNHISPPPSENDFNYLVDVYSKWYRNYFYFCSTYNCPHPNAISPSFDIKWARMEYVGKDKFNISYMRHTDKWGEIHQEISMIDSLKAIVEESYFSP